MATNLALANITATGGNTGRTLGDRWADVINVKDYGAVGDGVTDDSSKIQAAFNAAFGTSASPHGSSNATLNKPVWFPAGTYICSTTVTLTQVYGGHIYGSGMNNTTLSYQGVTATHPLLVIDGMENTHIEMLGFGAGMMDLDWSGSGTVGLKSNLLSDLLFSHSCGIGVRLGASSNEGNNMLFINVTGATCSAVVRIISSGATSTTLCSGGGADGDNVLYMTGGSASVFGPSYASNSSYDVRTENQAPVAVYGYRSESHNFMEASGRAIIAGGTHGSDVNGIFLSMPSSLSRVVVDANRVATGVLRSTGSTAATIYLRANFTDLSSFATSFTGNILQNI